MSQYQKRLTSQLAKLEELTKLFPEDRDEVIKYEKLYAKLIEDIQTSGLDTASADAMFAGLHGHLRQIKRRVIAKYKITKRDVDVYVEHYKKYKKKIIPLLDDFDFNPTVGPASSVTIQDLSKIDFKMLSYTEEELVGFSFDILKHLNIHPELNIKDQTLKQLLLEVANNYNIVAYHHYTHAFSVFQMFFSLLQKTNLKDYLGNLEIFAGLISSLAHDMNHRGVNNTWHSKKKSYESQLYSDTSVMENTHISCFFEMMKKKPELSIVDSIADPNGRTQFKRLLVTNVLATDMVKHNKQVQKIGKRAKATIEYKDKIKAGEDIDPFVKDTVFLQDRLDDRRFISNVIVHACDIGNPALPFDDYLRWSVLVSQEFDSQTIKEAKHGLEVTGMLKFKDKKSFFDGQVFFIKFLVQPLWINMKILFTGLEDFLTNLDTNLVRLKEEKDKLLAA